MEIEGFQCLADVTEKAVEWVWEGLIPGGEITMVEGPPGSNKSSLCCTVAACLTKGIAMPHATPKGRRRKGGTLFLIGEDSIAKTVVPRLRAAEADLEKIAVLVGVTIPGDIERIEEAIDEIDAKLLVVDTLPDFVNSSLLSNQGVRNALRPLRELAEKKKMAVVTLRHFTKKSSGASLLRGGGSVALTAVARSQLKLYKHPTDPHMRVLIQDKSNLGPLSPSLLFEVVSAEDGQFRLECRGETDLTVADLEGSKGGVTKLAAAEAFLRQKLADGPKPATDLIEQAKGTCSKRTLDEAKKNLGLVTQRKGKGKNHVVSWTLPAVAEPKQRRTKAVSKPKKPAAKTSCTKKPADKKQAGKPLRVKPAKVYVPKASEIDIFEQLA